MGGVAIEVVEMLAAERGLPLERIELSSRLLEDLGMDGDDAVDFFTSLQVRFGTDFSTLHGRWSEHFSPEGFSCWNGLIIIAVAIIGGAIAGLLQLGALAGFGIAISLLVLLALATKKWGPRNPMMPITVAEVIHAVEAGAWPRRNGM